MCPVWYFQYGNIINCIMITKQALNMNEVNIRWFFNVSKWCPTREEIMKCTSCIQREEKERIGRFVFKNDFKSSLIGRLLLRKFVCKATNTPYNEIVFARDDHGKPILLNPKLNKIKFNISHQGDFVVLVGSNKSGSLGVDLMKMEYKGGKKLTEFFRLMSRQFSNYEWDAIKSGSNQDQINMFYRHWSLKESYVKAIGVGITIDLQNISFKVVEKNLKVNEIVSSTELCVNSEKQNWEFHELLLDSNHCVAVAMKGLNNEKVMFTELHIQEILDETLALSDEDLDYCDSYFNKMEKC